VTEAANANFDEFGEERFIEVLKRHRHEPAAAIVAAVTDALAEFAAGAPQADDITLVVAKRGVEVRSRERKREVARAIPRTALLRSRLRLHIDFHRRLLP